MIHLVGILWHIPSLISSIYPGFDIVTVGGNK
jgi:hypothetical protein